MPTEYELREALQSKAQRANYVHIDEGKVRGLADRRTSRRPSAVAASIGAVIVLAVTTLLLGGIVGHSSNPRVPSAAAHSSAALQVTPTPQSIAQTLIDLLDMNGRVSQLAGHGNDTYAADTMRFDDGHGPSFIFVTVAWAPPGKAGGIVPTGCKEIDYSDDPGDVHWATDPVHCVTLTDQTQLGTGTGQLPAAAGQPVGLVVNHVEVLRPNGIDIAIGAANAPDIVAGPASVPTRAAPPFSIDELQAAATSSAWSAKANASFVARANRLFSTR